MSGRLSRRSLLKRGAVAAAAVAGARVFTGPFILAADNVGDKARLVMIGCGGQGVGAHVPVAAREKLVALVDPSEKCIGNAMKKAQGTNPDLKASEVKTFADYRKMFDSIGKDIDAVIIATPNHHHATAALMAMQLGKGCYVEKPMAYNLAETRQMADFAKKYKVATQMGNQGHSGEGWRVLCEYIWAGAIGNVHTVHTWTNRANGGIGPRPPVEPVPAGMDWDSYIGPAPFRDFHKDIHPHEWHGWHDFGNGSLGNLACHVMDGAQWALKLGGPCTVEVEDVRGGTDERFPISTRICWSFPAREGMAPVKVYWYDGMKPGATDPGTGSVIKAVSREAQYRPALADELEKKYDRKFEGDASLYEGDKGVMCAGCYGGGVRMLPESAQQAFPAPAKTLPRVKGGHQGSWVAAVKGGPPAASNFEVAAKLNELVLLGCVAIKAGKGVKIEWDGAKVTNVTTPNPFIQRESRKGWTL